MVFCYILWTFGTVRGNLVYFFPFWYFGPRKIWQPCMPCLVIDVLTFSFTFSTLLCRSGGPDVFEKKSPEKSPNQVCKKIHTFYGG
jgi:hypothetical protein